MLKVCQHPNSNFLLFYKDISLNAYFHYYATYLAACLAGMPLKRAQLLAYYCQTMSTMYQGSSSVEEWRFQGDIFTPCLTGIDKGFDEVDLATQQAGPFNCHLAFRALPAFKASVFAKPTVQCQALAIRCHYNPLTDINWLKGGQFTPAFSAKLASKHLEQSQSRIISPLNNPLLICEENSDFCRVMLNDTINSSLMPLPSKGCELALLGVRLYTYQNSWHSAKLSKNIDNESRVKILLDCFYWTFYCVFCAVNNKYMEKTPKYDGEQLPIKHRRRFNALLKELLLINSNTFEMEYLWLKQLPILLKYHSTVAALSVHWQQGLRLRNDYLLEGAAILAKTNGTKEIRSLAGFKNSHFFKLNKAAEYHCQWLMEQMGRYNITEIDVNQSVGHSAIWQD